MTLRVLVVEDETVVCEAIRGLVADLGHTPVAHVESARDALRALRRLNVDVALVDIDLGHGPNGLAVARGAMARGISVVFITSADNPQTTRATFALGEFIHKPVTLPTLRAMLSRVDARRAHEAGARLALEALTPTQLRVCRVMTSGHSVRDTADYLGIAEQTVRNHLKVVFERLGVDSQDVLRARTQDDPRARLRHVLLVEDDKLIAADFAEALQQGGLRVTVAPTAEQATHVIREHVLDAAVLDIEVGGGLREFVELLRDYGVPFLFASGATSPPPFAADAIFLTKPLPRRLLVDEVTQLAE